LAVPVPEPLAAAGAALVVAPPVLLPLPAGPAEVLDDGLPDGVALVDGAAALLLVDGALLDGRALPDEAGALLDGRVLLLDGAALLLLLLEGAVELGRSEVLPAAEVGTEPIGATEVADFDGTVDGWCRLLPLGTACPGSTAGSFDEGPWTSSKPPAATAAIRAAPATRAPISGPRDRRSSSNSFGSRYSTTPSGAAGTRPAAGM
jgi:hypothetical protein